MELARLAASVGAAEPALQRAGAPDSELTRDWPERWERRILQSARTRYCDTEMGEELGWLMSPILEGFLGGWRLTADPKWVERFVDWADAWMQRGVREPDGFLGWPKAGSGGATSKELVADSLLGEAMALRPLVLMAEEIRKTPKLKQRWGRQADRYLKLAEATFEKWDSRSAWREVKDGGVWVAVPFGIAPQTGGWTEGYARRKTDGVTHPANKQNLIAKWLIALSDVTGKPVYRERAEQWWRVMKSRLRLRDERFLVWNYWDPAGPWDYKPNGAPKHWVGVHPKGGYYAIDVEGMTIAYEHGLVFQAEDICRLIATQREAMWNGQVADAKFARIDGGPPDARWPDQAGVLWTALVPYDLTLRRIFEAHHKPDSWGGLSATPAYLLGRGGKKR